MDEQNKKSEEFQSDEPVPLNKMTVALLMLFGMGILLIIMVFSLWNSSASQQETVLEEKKQFIEKGIHIGIDGSDSVSALGISGKEKGSILWAFSESGESAVFNGLFEGECRGGNPPVDLNTELPRSILALSFLGNNRYLGGTSNGQLNLYECINSELVIKNLLDDFRSSEIRDPIAGSGSISHIFTSPGKTRALVVNYDGLGRVYSISNKDIRLHSSFQLSAAAVAGDCISENEAWIVTADGRVSAFNIDQMAKPGLEFDVSEFGRIRGADYANGKFLIFGHSLDVKTASIAIYDRTGKLLEILTKGGVSQNPAAPMMPAPNSALDEMPKMADLGESFNDAKWLGEKLVGAVRENQFYFLDLNEKKVTGVELPLKPQEEARQFIRAGDNTFVIGTSGGRVFERRISFDGKF